MFYDYSALNGRIVEKFGSQRQFAKAMGLSERSVSLKLNNRVWWKQSEIETAKNLLHIDVSDLGQYFFKCKVQCF